MNRQVSGIIGLLAAILLFAGDMLLYGHFGSAASFWDGAKNVALDASLNRIFAGGFLGPIGALLYIVGFWNIYQNTQQAGKIAAKIVFICLTSVIVIGGAYHALWTIRMLLFKFAIPEIQSLQPFTESVYSYLNFTYTMSSIPGYLAFPILIIQILMGKTHYPRWTVIVNPGLWYILTFLFSGLPAPFGAIIMGGYFNLTFILFFTVSLITTWKVNSGT